MVRFFNKCESGLISWVWVMVVRQVWYDFGGFCSLILGG